MDWIDGGNVVFRPWNVARFGFALERIETM
jgi:hypothetical protein